MLPNTYYLYGITKSPPEIPLTVRDLWDLPIEYTSYQGFCLLYSEVSTFELEKLENQSQSNFSTKSKYQWLLMALHRQDWHFLPFSYGTVIKELPSAFLYRNKQKFIGACKASKGMCEYRLELSFDYNYTRTNLFSYTKPSKRQQIAQLKALSVMRLLRILCPDLDVLIAAKNQDKPEDVSLNILISIEQIAALQKACQTILSNYSKLSVKATGPWPPSRLMPEYELTPKEPSGVFSFHIEE